VIKQTGYSTINKKFLHHKTPVVMKRNILLFLMIQPICVTLYGQPVSYGPNAGTEGNQSSYFGSKAGEKATSVTSFNTAIGNQAMANITNGCCNVAVGSLSLQQGGHFCTAIGHGAMTSNSGSSEDPGMYNTGVGWFALHDNQSADYNTAVGSTALSMFNSGNDNTALGNQSLRRNSTGGYNTATGSRSLSENNSGVFNTANGYSSLYANKTGDYNAATGSYSLYSNVSGVLNTANGHRSLYANTTGSSNTATGVNSLYSNVSGHTNTAHGSSSLYLNTTGNYNTATGAGCMFANTSGNWNTAHGWHSLSGNKTGHNNTATGTSAMSKNVSGNYNTASGYLSLYKNTTGSYNSALGYDAGPTLVDLNNTTAIGYLAIPTASDQVRIGNTAVTSIGGQVDWTAFSDGRFKNDIKEDVSGLDFINHLRPVSYVVDKVAINKFLHVSDSSGSPTETKSAPMRQTGFIAQEVEALVKKTGYVFSGIDAPKNENDPYGIRYATFVVPLVKAMQELSTKVEEQQEQIQLLLAQLYSKSETDTKGVSGNTKAFLLQNNPNPFTSETEIKMTLPENVGNAAIMIYTLEGKQLKNIRVHDRGDVSVKISGNELSAGMYLYTLIADGKVLDTKRMVLTQ
jgi:trimeric autotransporter adhesin